jgi:hypothetical protein
VTHADIATFRSELFGSLDAHCDELAPPTPFSSRREIQAWPNFVLLFWERGWYLTYHYWPIPSEEITLTQGVRFVTKGGVVYKHVDTVGA